MLILDSRLSHLTNEELKELMELYYLGEKPSILIKRFNIDGSPSQLYKMFPEDVLEEVCPYCESSVRLLRKQPSFSSSKNGNPGFCPECGHKNDSKCGCDPCVISKEENEKNLNRLRTELVLKRFRIVSRSLKDYSSLSAEQKLNIAAVVRSGIEQNLDLIAPLKGIKTPITPSQKWTFELLCNLFNEGVICYHPASPLNAFTFDEDELVSYKVFEVYYHILVDQQNEQSRVEFVDMLLNPKEALLDTEFCFEMWTQIAREEVLAYLIHRLDKVKFPFNPGPKTTLVINEMLKHFSVSQIYNIINRQVANAASLFQERNLTRQHAANTVISGCERFTEHAISKQWDITKFNRINELPESALSLVFFNRVLGIGNEGFHSVPSKEFLIQLKEDYLSK